LIQLKGVVLFGTNGAHTLYSYFTLLDNDMALYMVLFVWGAFSVVLTLYYYYNSMPQIAGTSDYYIRLVEMGNGCKGQGQFKMLFMLITMGKVVTCIIGIYGACLSFTGGSMDIMLMDLVSCASFVGLSFLGLSDIIIELPEADDDENHRPVAMLGAKRPSTMSCCDSKPHTQELSTVIFPPGELPLYFEKISWLSGARQAIADSNYLHSLRCRCDWPDAPAVHIPEENTDIVVNTNEITVVAPDGTEKKVNLVKQKASVGIEMVPSWSY